MSNKILVYPVSGFEGDVNWILNSKITNDIQKADIIVFPGGADVNPKLYGFKEHPSTYISEYSDKRDIVAYEAMRPDQLAVGICRGAQFLCVMNGGKLIQNVKGHAIGRTHPIRTVQSPTIELQALSLHHQMMYPFNLPDDCYTMLYKSNCGYEYCDSVSENGKPLNLDFVYDYGEPEVVVFHKENKPIGLAIQSHPEMMRLESGFVKEMNNIIVELLKKD